MKCKICKQKTDWDSSVGRPAFIVCNNCVECLSNTMMKILEVSEHDKIGALGATSAFILDMGYKMENKGD